MITKFKFWLFGKSKVLLAFEYGVLLSETAQKLDVKITREFMERAEVMIVGEFSTRNAEEIAIDMSPNILSAFELDLSK